MQHAPLLPPNRRDEEEEEEEEYQQPKKAPGRRHKKKRGSHKLRLQHRKQAGHMTYSSKANAEYKKEQKQQQKQQQKAQQTHAQEEEEEMEEEGQWREVQPEDSTTRSTSGVIEVPVKRADSSNQVGTSSLFTFSSVCTDGAAHNGGVGT